jgi:hypothetical protein
MSISGWPLRTLVPVVTSATFCTQLSERIEITETRRSSSWMVPGARIMVWITRRAAGSDLTPARWILPGDSRTDPSSVSSPSNTGM